MLAEYVALRFSYVIVSFCWNHPKYQLRRFEDSSEDTTERSLGALLGSRQVVIVLGQLGAEIIVDYISRLLEIGNGIDFQPLQYQGFNITMLLIWATTPISPSLQACSFKCEDLCGALPVVWIH